MIGYMKPGKTDLSKEDRKQYQAIYCGLCRCLKYEYGFTGIATLNYVAANTLLLIGAMAQHPFPERLMSCSITPFIWRRTAGVNHPAFHAAAAVSIAAADMEIRDNLQDSNKWRDRLMCAAINPKMDTARQIYRFEIEKLELLYSTFLTMEATASAGGQEITFKMLTNASADIIAEAARIIGVYAQCEQLNELYSIMHLWGQWIYLVDAVDDFESDKRAARFNPIILLEDNLSAISTILDDIEMEAKAAIDAVILSNYVSVVNVIFCKHLPHRRKVILGNANL